MALIVAITAGAVFACLRTDAGRRLWFDFVGAADAHDKAIVAIGIRYIDAFKTNRSTKFRLVKGGGNMYPVVGSDLFSANEGNEAD